VKKHFNWRILAVISLDENIIMSYSIDRFLGVEFGSFILHLLSYNRDKF